MKKRIGAVMALLVLLAGGVVWWMRSAPADAVQYRSAPLTRGTLEAAVAASGTVNPVAQVSVGTQVSGQIRDLYVDFNAEVKAGQLLAQIDPETFEYRVRSSQADVDAARAAVLTAQANLLASRAQVSRAEVDLAEARRDFERKQSLVEKQFIAQSEGDKARALVNTSLEALKAVQAQVGVAQAQVTSAQANVAQRDAALAQARIDLARTRITSPVGGIVIKRAIERGQTVASSLQAPELFVIAQNLSDMQVEASIDESDVGRLKAGQKASFTVDAFPGQTFEGEVRQVRKAAVSVANVVTYVAVIGFSNSDGRLLPGMTANVRVLTDQRENVLKAPNAALRMRIAGSESNPGVTGQAQGPASAASVAAERAGSGANAEMRARLKEKLQLTTEQAKQVDDIYEQIRPKLMQMRDLPQEQRGHQRQHLMAQVHTQIANLLTPEQKTRYAALTVEQENRSYTQGRLYVLDSAGRPQAVPVRLGITDGNSTEVLPAARAGVELKEGTEVVVGVKSPGAGAAANSGRPSTNGPRPPF
jgi:HlyD family secretion protein